MELKNREMSDVSRVDELRDVLFDELRLLRENKIPPQRARVTANISKQIIDSMRVQVQFGRLINDARKLPDLPE